MRKTLLPILCLLLAACGRDDDKSEPYKGYKCVYGIHKARQVRERIGCYHQEMISCSTNQGCADKVAEQQGIPKKDVTIMANYTNHEYIPTTDCNCPQ